MKKKLHPTSGTKKRPQPKRPPRGIELTRDKLIFRFDRFHEVLPRLLGVVKHFSDGHLSSLHQPIAADDNVLGGERARVIVSGCAGSTAWMATLGDLGLNPLIFRSCVANGINAAGYVPPDDIPAAPDTRLLDVVFAIQGAQSK